MRPFLLVFSVLFLISCSDSGGVGVGSSLLPKARGEADEIIIVVDSTQWADSQVGEELKKTFNSPMLGLPQDEPLFNASKVNPRRLNSVLKSAKNMVFVMTLDSKTADSRALQQFFTSQSLNQIKRDTSIFMRQQNDLFAKGQTALFLFSSSEELLAQKQETTQMFNYVLIAIAAISLLVGGIGIMNIMLASVMERIKEIGVRLSLGATKRDIVTQFMSEAVALALVGGLIGVATGVGFSLLIEWSAGVLTIVTWVPIVVSFLVAFVVGVLFGFFPALKAARQDPVVSLRHD